MSWFFGTVVNKWLLIGLAVGFSSRFAGGQAISVSTGMALGVLTFEALTFVIWSLR